MRFDERLFDREYRRVVDASMSFLYVQAGRTFDKQRPKAPPYIHIDGESRIVLRKGEDVVTKMKTGAPSQKVRQYFQEIVRLYNQVIGGVNQNQSLELQIQSIIENIFRSVR